MLAFLIRTVVNALALQVIAEISHGALVVRTFSAALLVALALGLANATVKPLLLFVARGMTCVLSCITLGLWGLFLSFVVNGFLLWGAAQLKLGLTLKDNNFWTACWAALALACVNALISVFTRREHETR